MKQTPAHDRHNADILRFMPKDLARVVEVGCSSGALARAYTAENPRCDYTGIEIDPDYAELARRACRSVICADVELLPDDAFGSLFPSDCWIFGDSLEHLRDPWAFLKRVRSRLAPGALIIACIPNAQHWSVQVRLNCGELRYEDQGLLDRTHLRWFTRITIIDLFQSTGFRILEGASRIAEDPARQRVIPAIRAMATAAGADPQLAEQDSLAVQYVVKATPV
ncbi:MAG: methyltransferase domain-containing protein [Pseudomonadota bacterium]|nr:methyltransferase domain-containing protein [Pseudomonadota bacterium]